jgi:glycosyl transferase family 25
MILPVILPRHQLTLMMAGKFQMTRRDREQDEAVVQTQMRTDWPVYILSLEGDEERRAPLLSALAEMGISAEVLIGVDGRNGLPAWAEKKIMRRRLSPEKRPLTDGEYACALSHVNAYVNILEKNHPGAIIFEDDATIDSRFKAFLNARAHLLGDMVLLGHKNCWVKKSRKFDIAAGLHLYSVANNPLLAHAYSISRTAAQTLLTAATPVREPADWPCDLWHMNVFAIDPQVAHQTIQDIDHSHLEADRLELISKYKPEKSGNKLKNFFFKRLSGSWWRTWFVRRTSRKLS